MAPNPNYRVTRKLGQGGMGEVYLAEDVKLGRPIALKLLPDDLVKDPQRRQRFLTEARAASALKHPNVCVIYEVGETLAMSQQHLGKPTKARAALAKARQQMEKLNKIFPGNPEHPSSGNWDLWM